jgi:hypothetical protein
MKRAKLKKNLITGVIIAAIAAVILTVPFPFRVNFSHPGFRQHRDSSEEQITMAVKGWRWRSLMGYDNMNGTMEITESNGESITFGVSKLAPIEDSGLHFGGLSRFDPRLGRYTARTMFASSRMDMFIAGTSDDHDYFDMASANGNHSRNDIWELLFSNN